MEKVLLFKTVLQERTISDFNITHLIMYNVLPFLCNAIFM